MICFAQYLLVDFNILQNEQDRALDELEESALFERDLLEQTHTLMTVANQLSLHLKYVEDRLQPAQDVALVGN